MFIGTVSEGTLNTRALVLAFAKTLKDLVVQDPFSDLSQFPILSMVGKNVDNDEVLDVLFSDLADYAPEGFYFGAHPSDGADFGFWAVES